MDKDRPLSELNRYILPKPDSLYDIYSVKPAVFTIQPEPFDSSTYDGKDIRPDIIYDDETLKKNVNLKPDHVIRYRYVRNKNGEMTRQSNSRMIKWSDGTKTLYIGKEAFGIKESNLPNHHHLFIRHKWSENDSYYEMHGNIKRKLTFNASKDTYRKEMQKLQLRRALTITKKKSSLFTVGSADPRLEKQEKEKFERNKSDLQNEYSGSLKIKKKQNLSVKVI